MTDRPEYNPRQDHRSAIYAFDQLHDAMQAFFDAAVVSLKLDKAVAWVSRQLTGSR